MKVPEFNQKFGTDAGEDLIGSTIRRDQLYGFGGNDGSTPWAAMTSFMAGPETTC